MNKVIHLCLICCAILFVGQSCTREKVGGCPNVTVRLEYRGDGSTDVLQKYIANVTYYIYDESGNYVTEGYWPIGDGADETLQRYLRLEKPGHYTLVCWGNLEHYSRATNTGQMGEACVCPLQMGGEGYTSCDPLYFGQAGLEVSEVEGDAEAQIDFHSAHITLWMYAKGVEDIGADGTNLPPQFCVAGCQGECDFQGSSCGQPFDFIPESVYDEDERVFMARCHVARFDENTGGVIEVYRTTGHLLLTTVSLKEFIADNGLKLSGKEEIDIPILLEFGPMGVTVTLPKWDVEESKPVM